MPRTPAQAKAVPGAVLPKEYGASIAAGVNAPIGQQTVGQLVPDEFRSALPPVEEIEEELTRGLRALPPPQRPKRKARSKTPAAATPPRERKRR